MAVEAQRLIAVSLGKIASARGRRTGVDLHKNLLVSTVLQRAKNVFIIETYRATVQAKTEAAKAERKSQSVSSRPHESMDTENHAQSESDVQSQQNDQDFSCSENKENDPAAVKENKENTTATLMECNDKLQEKTVNCDKTRPSCDVLEPKNLNKQKDYSTTSCGGCVNKRRHSEIEEDMNSSKRARYDNNSPALGSKKSQDSQISSLVNIFNSGFSGLVNVAQQSTHHLKGQGYSSDNPVSNSCATAVANGFTKLAGPIIAMAMTV
jgi:hypothetical protein